MTRLRHAIAMVACASLLVAVLVAPGTGAGAASTRTAKCAGPGALRTGAPAGTTTRTVTVAGESRTYRIEVPARYTQSRAAPLLFDFHGLGSNKEQQELYSRLELKGGKAGYVVVTPDGSGTLAKRWVPPPLPGTDLDFVRAVLHSTEQELCIDARRVFAAGMSSGAVFSTALACALPGTFAAIAPVAGVNAHAVCDPGTPPVSVLAFHGTADGVVPYQGGAFFSGVDAARLPAAIRDRVADLAGLQARPVPEAVAQWAAFDGCSATPRMTDVAEDVTRTAYRGCVAGTAVVLDTVAQGGHTWPGGVDVARLGPTTHSIDASDLIVRFFTAHPRRA